MLSKSSFRALKVNFVRVGISIKPYKIKHHCTLLISLILVIFTICIFIKYWLRISLKSYSLLFKFFQNFSSLSLNKFFASMWLRSSWRDESKDTTHVYWFYSLRITYGGLPEVQDDLRVRLQPMRVGHVIFLNLIQWECCIMRV